MKLILNKMKLKILELMKQALFICGILINKIFQHFLKKLDRILLKKLIKQKINLKISKCLIKIIFKKVKFHLINHKLINQPWKQIILLFKSENLMNKKQYHK